MSRAAVSVIIVSQKRPHDLERVVGALAYQSLRNFEIVVVSDGPPLSPPFLDIPLRYVPYDEANISRARNLGLKEAKAPIVAFCDDDAVPDPYWLERLVVPFYEDKSIAAAGGFVRGRNGISYQWRAVGFYANAVDFDLEVDESKSWTRFEPREDFFVKTVGTNSAFLRQRLFEIGGYDEGFHYYLDDTDVNIRLQKAGYATAIVPDAQVIHNFARSRGRKENRVPQSLYNIGASTNLYLRKHCPGEVEENLKGFYEAQEERLKRYFYLGLITSKQMRRLMRDLSNGLVSGALRQSLTPLKKRKGKALVARKTRRLDLKYYYGMRPNLKIVQAYPIFVRMLYSNHAARLGFHRAGYWRVSGGRFGRIERKGAIWRYRSRRGYQMELTRVLGRYF